MTMLPAASLIIVRCWLEKNDRQVIMCNVINIDKYLAELSDVFISESKL